MACWLNYAKRKEREQRRKGERVLVGKGEREQVSSDGDVL
jgi:hypothetical protein